MPPIDPTNSGEALKADITYGIGPAAVGCGEERTASLAPAPPADGAVRSRSPHPTPTTSDTALGWEDVRDLPAGSILTKTFPDDTLPGGPVQRTITYQPPFIRPDREQDYRVARAFFEESGSAHRSIASDQS
ncbi:MULTISPECIES: hypothetical protein [unclassified Thiocapsa]|uniref:hypothetical protein n=1 Tax=unclassified Thiocapsa TaxID=2641286 RepID=UPI0035B3E278